MRFLPAAFAFAFVISLSALASFAQAKPGELVPLDQVPAGIYANDPTHSSLTFKVSHMGLSHYTARFTKIDAKVTLDPKDPTKSTVTATIDPTSIRTDYPQPEKEDFDKKLGTGAEWLNASKFPAISFTSTSIQMTGDKTANIHGDLTFLGVTKPVVLNATLNGAYAEKPMIGGAAFGISAVTQIKRSDWGFGTYVPMIGDAVDIMIELEFGKNDVFKTNK